MWNRVDGTDAFINIITSQSVEWSITKVYMGINTNAVAHWPEVCTTILYFRACFKILFLCHTKTPATPKHLQPLGTYKGC